MSTLRTTIVAGAILVFSLATANAQANLTHTTSNLNLRGGPGTQYPIRAVIPARAEIDVHSCGHQWCYTSWAARQGYVSRDYLIHHVATPVSVITHVTHVHYHTIY